MTAERETERREGEDKVCVDLSTIDDYISRLSSDGYSRSTVNVYRAAVRRFYNDLPGDKQISRNTLQDWQAVLVRRGLSQDTASRYQRSVHGLFRYLDCPKSWYTFQEQLPDPVILHDGPKLNRAEYLLLLQTARELGREKAYLLIKTMCLTGATSTEIPQITVSMLRNGRGWVSQRGRGRLVIFPPMLGVELLRYAGRQQIEQGAVFVTAEGARYHHVLVWKQMTAVYRRTGLPAEKGKPNYLSQLYWDTKEQLQRQFASDAERRYLALLAKEETAVCWPVQN